ncbi:MAG: protein-disulfide reductase DsbD N-terminal domain-containing protein [Gammaproteobacteria bacterium]|nr:MAG: hypothetical protein EVA53_01745 [Gammaproteobacteria bacterium]
MLSINFKIHIFIVVFFISLLANQTITAQETENKTLENLLFEKEKILNPEDAFIMKGRLEENKLILTWVIKENCYLYKNKFFIFNKDSKKYLDFTLPSSNTITDEFFGEVEVFYNFVETFINIDLLSSSISVSYQGCNAQGYCYSPIQKTIEIKENKIKKINKI